jgi:hypothetical protein
MRVASPTGYFSKSPVTRYIRPRKERVRCTQCTAVPDGFRGGHELRRHRQRVHSQIRKVWVCVDASPDKAVLRNCKQCESGKKYAAAYNAAAHLRRRHFNDSLDRRNGEERLTWGMKIQDLKGWLEEREEVIYGRLSYANKS